VAGAAASAAALAPVAAAVPFGANLNRPANNAIGCEVGGINASPFQPGGLVLTPSNRPTCTWTSTGALGNLSEALFAPGTGTVTRLRIRTGPVTGPMQVVAFSSLSGPSAPAACCQVRAVTAVFRPRPNGVTILRTALPVVAERVPPPGSLVTRQDALGLSVLRPGVLVPAHNTGNFDALAAQSGAMFHPALVPGRSAGPAGFIGFQPLLNAEFVRGRSAGSAGGSERAGTNGRCAGRGATVVGTTGNDTLRGTNRRDVFAGLAGDDRILGMGGNDIACGGPGNDLLLGGQGNDLLDGGPGRRDRNRGGPGRDRCLRGASAGC
jgi:hypothetical protein